MLNRPILKKISDHQRDGFFYYRCFYLERLTTVMKNSRPVYHSLNDYRANRYVLIFLAYICLVAKKEICYFFALLFSLI